MNAADPNYTGWAMLRDLCCMLAFLALLAVAVRAAEKKYAPSVIREVTTDSVVLPSKAEVEQMRRTAVEIADDVQHGLARAAEIQALVDAGAGRSHGEGR